jgi:hypothetical protein
MHRGEKKEHLEDCKNIVDSHKGRQNVIRDMIKVAMISRCLSSKKRAHPIEVGSERKDAAE